MQEENYRAEVKKDKQDFVRKILEEKVCELALKGLDDECHACRRRYHNGQEIIKTLRQLQECGEEMIKIEDAITYIEAVSSIF